MLHRRGLLVSVSTVFSTALLSATIYCSPLASSPAKDSDKTTTKTEAADSKSESKVEDKATQAQAAPAADTSKNADAVSTEEVVSNAVDVHFEGWTLRKTKNPDGSDMQFIMRSVATEQGPKLLSMVMGQFNNKDFSLYVTTPAGVWLRSHVRVKIDDHKERVVEYTHCTSASGCQADANLSAVDIKEWINGKNVNIKFDTVNMQTISVDIPLKGFGAAYKEYNKSKPKAVKKSAKKTEKTEAQK